MHSDALKTHSNLFTYRRSLVQERKGKELWGIWLFDYFSYCYGVIITLITINWCIITISDPVLFETKKRYLIITDYIFIFSDSTEMLACDDWHLLTYTEHMESKQNAGGAATFSTLCSHQLLRSKYSIFAMKWNQMLRRSKDDVLMHRGIVSNHPDEISPVLCFC